LATDFEDRSTPEGAAVAAVASRAPFEPEGLSDETRAGLEPAGLSAGTRAGLEPVGLSTQTVAVLDASYAPKLSLPVDPMRYDSTRLRTWRTALGTVASAPVNILAIGDSWSSGKGATSIPATRFLDRLRDLLRGRYNPATVPGAENYWPSYNFSFGYANPITYTGSTAAQTTFGLGRATTRIASGGSATFTFTGTGCDIVYAKGATGAPFTYTVDGGSPSASVITNQGAAQGGNTVQIRGLTLGSHTVVATPSADWLYLEGFTAYNGDESKGVRMFVGAFTGYRSSDFVDSNGYTYKSYGMVNPHLAMIELGINDFGGGSAGVPVSPSALASNVQALISAIRANTTTSPSIVLWLPPETTPSVTPLAPWSDYVTALQGVASSDGKVTLFDAGAAIGSLAGTADPLGVDLGDNLHPNQTGHDALAYALYRLLSQTV